LHTTPLSGKLEATDTDIKVTAKIKEFNRDEAVGSFYCNEEWLLFVC